MIADNETIKGENGQIVRGGDLSYPGGGRGFVRMSAVIFSSFLLNTVDWLGRSSQVKSVS